MTRAGFKVSGAPTNNKGWKARYFFVSGPSWGFRADWSIHPISNVPPLLSEEESIVVNRLRGIIPLSWVIRDMTERWLVEAGLILAFSGYPKPRMPGEKTAPTAGPKSSQPKVEVIHMEASAKWPVGSPLTRARQRVDELEADNVKLRSRVDELTNRLEEADKELNELREGLAESQHQLREQKVDCRKANDELLKLMRENESLKAELPSKSVINYKQSVGFGWGLRRMGQVLYEYGYRVALARFQARYSDLEVDSDPFTEQLENSSVPMETHQEFDDSIPPEE
ncbi:hypothetical protein BHE74_00051838 [Ensete ventricosum]|nr:hypothetical protein BHE74_00051838 [Ensete ventricosum]